MKFLQQPEGIERHVMLRGEWSGGKFPPLSRKKVRGADRKADFSKESESLSVRFAKIAEGMARESWGGE